MMDTNQKDENFNTSLSILQYIPIWKVLINLQQGWLNDYRDQPQCVVSNQDVIIDAQEIISYTYPVNKQVLQ